MRATGQALLSVHMHSNHQINTWQPAGGGWMELIGGSKGTWKLGLGKIFRIRNGSSLTAYSSTIGHARIGSWNS